jgi:hypothetical protein
VRTLKRATRKRNRRQWLGGLNIISVISVNHHLASALPFPYFGQALPELLRNCLRAVRRKPVPPAIRPIELKFEIHVPLVWIVRCLGDSKLQCRK